MNCIENRLGVNYVAPSGDVTNDAPSMRETIPIGRAPPAKSPFYDYGRVTCAELATKKYEIDWLVDWMLIANQPCVMAGGKKTLKTSTALDLAISLATATPFLGEFEIQSARRVAMMTGESGEATISETALRISEAKGIDLAPVDNFVMFPRLPRFGDEKHLLSVKHLAEINEIEVLIIDPVYLCMPGADAGNLMIQGQMLRGISEVCQEIGVTLILLHHNKKNVSDPFEPPDLDSIAWAGFAEFARQWLLLGRREPFNPDDRTGTHRLWLSVGGSSGQSMLKAVDISEGQIVHGRHWKVSVFTAAQARASVDDRKQDAKEKGRSQKLEQKIDGHKRQLLAAMAKFAEGETKSVLSARAGLNPANMAIALAELLESGEVIACEIFKGNQKTPKEGYKLAKIGNDLEQVRQTEQEVSDSLSDS